MRAAAILIVLLCVLSTYHAVKSKSKVVGKKASRRLIDDDDDDSEEQPSKSRIKKSKPGLKKKGAKNQLVKWSDPRKLRSRSKQPTLKDRLESLAYQGSTAYKNAFRQVKVIVLVEIIDRS